MSQQQRPVVVVRAATPTNGLGVAGVVVSLVGLVATCGLLSPLGLLFSLIAMFKRPRGMAIAGLILGLIGSVWVIVAVFVIGVTAIGAAVGIGAATKHLHAMSDISMLAQAVKDRKAATGSLPADLKGLPGVDAKQLTDPWGNLYRLVKKDNGEFDIVSDGQDGEPDTSDDVRWSDFQGAGGPNAGTVEKQIQPD